MALRLRPEHKPAMIEEIPFFNPELDDDEQPDFAPVSMVGTCSQHGLERITRRMVGGGSDPTELHLFACGEVDPRSFG